MCPASQDCAIFVNDASKFDENTDCKIVEFIDKYITFSIPHKDAEPELHELVISRLTHKCATTCRKKKSVCSSFNSPWSASDQTRIVRGEDVTTEEVKQSKKVVDKVLHEIVDNRTTEELDHVKLQDILDSCGTSEQQYENAMETMQKNTTIHHKKSSNELNMSPYSTVLLSFLRANMNIQFVIGVHGLLTYLTSYLCKPEKAMSELTKKASKEASDKSIRGKMRKIGDAFLTKHEIGIHDATLRLISGLFKRSNVFVLYIPSGPQKDHTRMLKSRDILDGMGQNDTNIFATNMIEKYVDHPDTLEGMFSADFGTSQISKNVEEAPDKGDIQS